MNKIKQWFTKMNKFEKIVLILFAMFLTFIFLICLINIVVAIAYAGIKLKSVNWNNFSIAFAEDICFNISAIIATLITLIFSSFILYQKWKNFDMFSYDQKKKEKKIAQEFKKIPKNNLVMLNNKVGLIKSNLTQHTLLIGTTGSGKTTTALSIINQLVYKLNQTVIIIDGKGDDSLINKVKTIDNNAFVWVIGGKNVYNPLSSKNHIILSDKIMSLFDFSEPHYQAIAHNYLLFLIKVLIKKSFDITFENIVKYFPIKKVKTLLNKDDKEYDILKKFLDNEHDIKGFEHRLSIYAEQLNNSIGYENDLTILVKNHKVILFSLNSFKYPELASNMGKLLIQDLKEFATIKSQNQNINLIFDEFNLFVTDAVINLINKSRSFNYQCFLCFQEIKSLEVNKKNLTDIIFGNVSNIICQKVLDPNTAEYLAKVFGTKTSEALTHQIDYQNSNVNKGSIRAVEEYIAHPNDLKNLKIGQAYVKILLPSSNQYVDKIDVQNYIDE